VREAEAEPEPSGPVAQCCGEWVFGSEKAPANQRPWLAARTPAPSPGKKIREHWDRCKTLRPNFSAAREEGGRRKEERTAREVVRVVYLYSTVRSR
jgi:hypothetical protein